MGSQAAKSSGFYFKTCSRGGQHKTCHKGPEEAKQVSASSIKRLKQRAKRATRQTSERIWRHFEEGVKS